MTWVVLVLFLAGVAWYSQTRDYKEQLLPTIPVDVKCRPALLGPGLVLRVNNTCDNAIVAQVNLYNPTTNESKSFRLDLFSRGSGEVGHREGWALMTGDAVEIYNDASVLGRGRFKNANNRKRGEELCI